MLSNTLLTTLLLFSAQTTTTLALPTKTHCQCKIVPSTPSSTSTTSSPYAIDSPSAAHWAPASPSEDESASPSPSPLASSTICTTLASQLSRFQHTNPDLYALYLQRAPTRSIDDSVAQNPIPTSVLLSATSSSSSSSPSDASSASANGFKIVCYEDEPTPNAPAPLRDMQSSPLTLLVLQLVVVLSIVACIAEGLHMLKNLISPPPTPEHSLRLAGAEKRLLAIPSAPYDYSADAMASPGAEKKIRAYNEAPRYFVAQGRNGRREFIAYDDDSDDEINRPVL
ncbi:hypothetical protein COCC4DRAFT_185369 [Bipolaris maydis ATCC 48331]|uniref:Uncharacterized protein n=2 Tax=Cochliobolus heterostrophus TaxID=5016 RepID=M2U833_COCH5|nr:uncharacterized protein COCC4DRAFT_185369 [Bipolaris maydis ATCC 48331]EMD89906.1 hypothetical protein COCHEDRAFT_1031279 [Bipolaris maydis C5]KAH7563246.1 hypothetical protein BM1_00293 [Bipolaris maydis]ENI09882.1 hypothetical protein COCC4DRAFT_185369 [Bipolaris maydis ATCC 48331]KAJ5025406.1 hypothetical protein J3E73DRAFT_424312 [Bipolaris maydis]KAJ5064005.1 hypothetical protein J3E74DRAFT_23824 [Bipolaris maydis]